MEKTKQGGQKKKITSPRLMNTLKVLLAGAALVTIGGSVKEGIKIQDYPAKAEKGYSTILVYMDGSDLESGYGAATDDLLEMAQALKSSDIPSDQVHIVVEAGGSQNWEYTTMQGKEYGRFCMSADEPYDVEYMEARDMGDPDTLTDFINYGTQSYPADHYGLVFWNHGAGQIMGFGCDNQFDDSALSLNEIKVGIESSSLKQPFDFISLDACLMGNIELAAVLQGKTDYLIASEELEPQYGYDYSWICTVGEEQQQNSETMGKAVGESMIHTYESYYANNDYKLTLTLLDLTEYDDFHEEFHSIMEQALDKADDMFYQQLGKGRKGLQGFGDRGSAASEIVDLMDFMELMTTLTGDTSGYEELQKQYKNLVLDKYTKGYEKEPTGISIYLPSGANEWILQDMSVYQTVAFCDIYQNFLEGYRNYLDAESHVTWFSVDKEQQEITVQIDPNSIEEIAGAYLTTFRDTGKDGMVYLLSTDSDVVINRSSYLRAEVEKQYWGLKDEVLCLIETVHTGEYTEYLAPVLYEGELCIMHIAFSTENENGSITAITPVGVEKRQYEVKEGDVLYPLYPLEQADDSNEVALPLGYEKEEAADSKREVGTDIKSGDIYRDAYYIGNKISIDSMEAGDAELMLIDVEPANCMFGFMIQDTKQNLYYTEFVSGK